MVDPGQWNASRRLGAANTKTKEGGGVHLIYASHRGALHFAFAAFEGTTSTRLLGSNHEPYNGSKFARQTSKRLSY